MTGAVRRFAAFGSALGLLTLAGAFSAACQSSSTNVTGPGGTKCAVNVPATLPTIGADGGSGSLTITVAAECVWQASSAVEWVSITSSPTGQGSGNLTFTAKGNPTAAARRGALVVGERRVELTQSGAACQFTLTPQTGNVGAAGGEGSITLNGVEGCQWSATSQADWLSVAGPQSGSGSAIVRFTADANDGPARTGLIAIADRTFAVNQNASGSACAIALATSEQFLPASGGMDTVTVTAQGDCSWTAASQSSWITVASGAAGRGTGLVSLSIAPNTGATRVGLVTIGGQTYVVTQASGGSGGCTYSLASSDYAAPAGGGSTTVGVTAPAGCAWTASSGVPWIAIAGGGVGNGSGAATLVVAANTGAARSASVVVAGASFTVNQAAPGAAPGCSYALSAADHSAAAAGGTTTVDVSAGTGCGWTAASQASWITIISGAPGSGNGTVALSIAANAGGQRSGTATIAGQTLTINQAAAAAPGCGYTLSATDHSAAAAGGTTTVDVSAGIGCAWTAASQSSWITISNGAAGVGNGTVTLAIATNSGGQRSGTATIAGRTFTVNQAAAAAQQCTYALSASEQSVPSTGGPASVNVTAGSGCGWTASSQASWITIAGGASGNGNGTVTLAVALNLGGERSGSVTIAGRTHTITQASGLLPCTYQIDPTEASSGAAGGTLQIAVTAGLTCTWQAQSNASWITVTSGANGLGNGTVRLTVAANGGGQRNGTVTIAGQTVTVTQAPAPASCTYSLNPTTQSVGPLGGDFTVAVTTQVGCAWSATTGDNWITLTSDTTGTGNGTVTYRIGLGLLFSRSGRLTISGQNLTVNQAALLLSNAR